MITAFSDKRGAVTANLCYRAVLETIENAEAVDRFEFMPEADVFEFEHWPLERRKVEEQIAADRATRLVPRRIVVVIGGGSGIGRSAARAIRGRGRPRRGGRPRRDGGGVGGRSRGRALSREGDRRRRWTCGTTPASMRCSGGWSWSSAGWTRCSTVPARRRASPRSGRLGRDDLQQQLEVHYLGAVAAVGRAAAIMRRQGLGGSIVASVSKAAVVPGKEAVAYGGEQGGAAPGAPGGGGRAGPGPDPGERHQRRPDRHAGVPAVREGAGRPAAASAGRSSWRCIARAT